jgi:cytochrome c
MFSTTKLFVAFFVFISCSVSSVAHADQALANAKGCMACHQIDAKKIGPSYKMVAKQYRGQGDAIARLSLKVLDGGSGAWGEVEMPANRTLGVTQEDAIKLVTWVLSLK